MATNINVIRGTPLDDDLVGTAGADRMLGFDGNDLLRGLGGRDELFGMAGDDRLFGAAGNDVLNGGPGNDRLNGGPGNDVLIPGVGRDQLGGGPGNDTFLIDNLRGGVNNILDFTQGEDVIDVSGLLPNFQAGDNLPDFVRVLDRPAGTVIGLDPDGGGSFINVALLPGVTGLQLTAADLGLPGDGVTPPPPSGIPDGIVVVSSTLAGTPQNAARAGGTVQMNKSMSDDGLVVVFESEATNLVAGVGSSPDVYAKNLSTGAIQLVSATANGTPANGTSFDPVVSGDGRYVAFASDATNLVAGDTNNTTDVFRKDLLTGEVVRVSTNAANQQAAFGPSGAFGGIAISDDGTKIAFVSNATNLVSGDSNDLADVFVKDLSNGSIVRANTLTNGNQQTAGFPTEIAMSGNGNTVAFSTNAGLLGADTNGVQDVYIKNLGTNALTLGSTGTGGSLGNGSSGVPTLSDNGRFLAFESTASNLVASDTNNSVDVFVRDLQDNTTVRASTATGGGQQTGTAGTMAPTISGDGNVVVFQSDAGNFVAGDTNLRHDVFAKNLTTGETVRVSVDDNGAEALNASSGWPAVNQDGTLVAFEAPADELAGLGTSVYQVLAAPTNFSAGPAAAGGPGGPALALDEVLDGGGGGDVAHGLGPSAAAFGAAVGWGAGAADLAPLTSLASLVDTSGAAMAGV